MTLFATRSDVVVFPHHFGPSTSTAPVASNFFIRMPSATLLFCHSGRNYTISLPIQSQVCQLACFHFVSWRTTGTAATKRGPPARDDSGGTDLVPSVAATKRVPPVRRSGDHPTAATKLWRLIGDNHHALALADARLVQLEIEPIALQIAGELARLGRDIRRCRSS